MPYELIITHDFHPYKVGQEVTDEKEVATLLAGTNTASFVKRWSPPKETPAPAPEDKPAVKAEAEKS